LLSPAQFDVNPAQSAVNAMGSESSTSVQSDSGASIGKQSPATTTQVQPLDADRMSTAKTYWGNEVDSSNATTTTGIHVNPISAIRFGTKLNFDAQMPQGQ
jgi:hypothetical protein